MMKTEETKETYIMPLVCVVSVEHSMRILEDSGLQDYRKGDDITFPGDETQE